MSWTRQIEIIEKELKESHDSPCDAAYLYLMRGIAKGWVPANLDISEIIVAEQVKRLEKQFNDREKFCETVAVTPLNLLYSVNAFSIGQAAHHFRTQQASNDAKLARDFFRNYANTLSACKSTLFYRNNSEKIDRAIEVAKENHENLQNFENTHAKCLNSKHK